MSDKSRNFQTRVLPWALVLATVAGLAIWALRDPAEPASAARDPSSADTVAAPPPVQRVTPTPAGARASIAAAKKMSTERRARTQARVDETHKLLSERYETERIDPNWAAGKEQELASLAKSDLMSAVNANVSNLTVDCKATACLIEGDFPTTTAGDDWVTLYMGNLGSKLPNASYKYERKPDGTVRIRVYGIGRR